MTDEERSDDKVTLKEFFLKLLEEQTKRIDTRFDSLDKALTLSHEEMERRLQGLNQLREEVMSDRSQFALRERCEARHKDLQSWQDSVNSKLTTLETRSITWTAAVGIFFLIISVAMRWLGK